MKAMSAPISESRAQLVKDGQTTKTDILTMFGNPNGYIQGTTSQQGIDAQAAYLQQIQNVMHYKDCDLISSSKVWFMGAGSGSGRVICKVFTALLNKKDIVIAHAFIEDNQITKDKLSGIIPKKSSRKEVIRLLGGPSTITINSSDEIYMYEDCISNTQTGGVFSMFRGKELMKSDNNCQQTSIVLNGNSGIVKKVSYFPYQNSD
jgi:outer membrane protein assembly factor BamE (lipoprotein component of BamABCDE complex)